MTANILIAIFTFALLALLLGSALCFAAKRLKGDRNALVEQINAILPQTQCGQCDYAGCRPYAAAIAQGEAINKCPPGGEATIQALANLLEQEAVPLNTEHGTHEAPQVVIIREDDCIGCTLCIQACPVDAIVGTAKQMHTVITDACTGCKLCLPPCPVDCIDLTQRVAA